MPPSLASGLPLAGSLDLDAHLRGLDGAFTRRRLALRRRRKGTAMGKLFGIVLIVVALALVGAAVYAMVPRRTTIASVAQVDLPRFLGPWYVIATVPTPLERKAYNAVESYAQNADGSIATTFRYRKGAFDAPLDTLHPRGFVRPGTGNAVWDMQFLAPFKAEYVIAWLAPDYSQTLIARSARDYAWLMARTPSIPDADYTAAMDRLRGLGYDVAQVRRVPQQWPEAAEADTSAAPH